MEGQQFLGQLLLLQACGVQLGGQAVNVALKLICGELLV